MDLANKLSRNGIVIPVKEASKFLMRHLDDYLDDLKCLYMYCARYA